MEAWILTVIAVLAAASASAMTLATVPRGRILKVPKVYNALITSDIPLLPSRAETAATAAVGPVLLYSSHLPVLLQPQAAATTPQNHLDKLSQLQTQFQREESDQRYQQQLLGERQLPQHLVSSQPVQQQLVSEPQLSVQPPYPAKQLPVQQQLYPERQLPVQPPYPAKQLSVQQQLYPEPLRTRQQQLLPDQLPARLPVQQQLLPQQLPARLPVQQQLYPEPPRTRHQQLLPEQLPVRLPVQQQLYPEPPRARQQHLLPEHFPLPAVPRQLPVQQQLYSEGQQLASSHHQPLQAQQVPVQHLSSERLIHQFDPKPTQFDTRLQQKQLQVHQQKQLQLNQYANQKKVQQDSSYLPMPEMNSYQPPPSIHIDDIKNNKPSNAEIPDVPPPPLPVGKRLHSYSYNSPELSPPPPTNHHVPYG